MSNHEGEGNQDKSNNEPESLVQMLDAKCETRFERIESLLADMAKSLKRKDRDHDSSEDESGDKTSGSGRDHNAAKCAKQTSERAQADNSEDKQSEDGEIIDDSVSVADSETNLLDELDRDLDDQEVTGAPVAESLAKLANNRFQSSMSVDKVKERMEKYPRPTNCTALVTPEVNKEIWKNLGKSVQSADIKLQHTQKAIVKAGMALMHSTQSLLRAQRGPGEASREEIKKAIAQNADAVALLGHASHELSLFRRINIRPSLEQSYMGLCSDKVPVTNYLFGDDLAGSMKEVQETNKLCAKVTQNSKADGKQHNKGYYKKTGKNHFLGQSYHRGRGRGASNSRHFYDKKKQRYQKAKQE
ncbi:hypothetical protein BaRGS_00036486 [Batillaria attramentaria]|uniref:Uncharacterized protein n=1 Tax=Batillaria attramentaria TaxID=370345 RepID=A0ABD0JCZ0_9CAEN